MYNLMVLQIRSIFYLLMNQPNTAVKYVNVLNVSLIFA